ncbi:MAG: phosphotransferase family protein [Actinomycetota bacterium]|nr:phosphotransferase family protein [Actinomycetota bacterium]
MTTGPDEALLDSIPQLRGPRQVSELPGGLTNRNYRVSTQAGEFVVRVSPAGSELLSIDRDNEHRNSVIAASSGVGAPVIAYRPEARVMVVGYIDGQTFTDASFAVPGNLARVATSCKKLHDGQRFINDFNMFQLQHRYLTLVQERGFQLPPGYLDYQPQVERIREALKVREEPTVACNNDLLAGNFVDDGNQIWLIDYEYSGNNDPCFELGNIWSECHLSLEQLEELVQCYYQKPSRDKLARAQLQGLMSRYGWTLWASIQQASSELDFDFWSWGMEKYDAAVAMFRGPDFERLLQEVQDPRSTV